MRRWAFIVLAVAGLLAVTVVLVWWLAPAKETQRLSVLAVLLAVVVSLVAIAVSMLQDSGSVDISAAADRLSAAVRGERQQFLNSILATPYDAPRADLRVTPPARKELPPAVDGLLVRWQPIDDATPAKEGTLTGIADYYCWCTKEARLRGRLLIAGEPGSGKSVLASQLVVDLLPSPGDPRSGPAPSRIPVWLSLTGWDIDLATRQGDLPKAFTDWLASQISDAYPVRAAAARALIENGRILPVLDGLDEIDPRHAKAVITALNEGKPPVVITSRTDEYAGLTQPDQPEADRPVLSNAAHVMVRPLDPATIEYFLASTLTADEQARWGNVLAAIRSGGSVTEVLARPLLLSFACRACQGGTQNPDRLLDLTPDTAMAELARPAITATVQNDPDPKKRARQRGWTPDEVVHWLETLAVNQRDHATQAQLDIRLPDLWTLGGHRPRWALPSIFATAGVVTGIVAALNHFPAASGGSVIAGPLLAAVTAYAPAKPSDIARLTLPRTRAAWHRVFRSTVTSGLIIGVLSGLTIGVMFGSVVGLTYGIRVGLEFGLTATLILGLPTWLLLGVPFGLIEEMTSEPAGLHNCSELVRQCRTHALVAGLSTGLLAGGLMPWMMLWLTFELTFGLTLGLAVGLLIGMTFGNWHVWVRYGIGTALAARRDAAPHRMTTFLDWGLATGVFRMSGYMLQFRHRELYQALLTPTTGGQSAGESGKTPVEDRRP